MALRGSGGEVDDTVREQARSLWIELTQPSESAALEAFHRALGDVERRPWSPRWLAALLLSAGLTDADHGELVWTPSLDAVASTDLWPRTHHLWAASSTDPETGRAAGAFDRVRGLRPWLLARTDPREVEPLLAFEAPAFAQAVARWGPIDRELGERLLERDRRHFVSLAAAHRLIGAHGWDAKEILDRALDELAEGHTPSDGRNWVPAYPRDHHAATEALLRLSRRQPSAPVGPAQLDRLCALATDADREGEGEVAEQALRVLLALPELSTERLHHLLAVAARREALLVDLIAHPSADVDIWRRLARDHGTRFEVASRLVGQGALQDPEVRAELARSESPYVLENVVASGGRAGAVAFRRLLDVDEKKAVDLTRRGLPGDLLAALEAESLAPLLSHEDPEVRNAALAALGRTPGREGGSRGSVSR